MPYDYKRPCLAPLGAIDTLDYHRAVASELPLETWLDAVSDTDPTSLRRTSDRVWLRSKIAEAKERRTPTGSGLFGEDPIDRIGRLITGFEDCEGVCACCGHNMPVDPDTRDLPCPECGDGRITSELEIWLENNA